MVYVTEDRSGFFEDGNGNVLDDGGECDGPAIWSAAADGGNLPDSAVSCPFFLLIGTFFWISEKSKSSMAQVVSMAVSYRKK